MQSIIHDVVIHYYINKIKSLDLINYRSSTHYKIYIMTVLAQLHARDKVKHYRPKAT